MACVIFKTISKFLLEGEKGVVSQVFINIQGLLDSVGMSLIFAGIFCYPLGEATRQLFPCNDEICVWALKRFQIAIS